MPDLAIRPEGPFSLAAARAFLAQFAPAGQVVGDDPDRLLLAFAVDGTDAVCAVAVRQQPDGTVVGDVLATLGDPPPAAVTRQVARILSLDVDATGFARMAAGDPVLGGLDLLRPVLFSSPYEAAAWSVLSARTPVPVAATLRRRVVEATGTALTVDGTELLPFPPAARILTADLAAIPAVKGERLRVLAAAAPLDAPALRRMDPDAAMADLRRLPGIGPFYAMLVLIRGAGAPDVLPVREPRVRRAAARAYGRPELADDDRAFAELAASWRPWRSWAAFNLRAAAAAASIA